MQLTEHVQAIVKSAKSIVAARNYPKLEPEHIMLAIMLDGNDLPKILFQKLGMDNPIITERLNNYLSKRSYYARGKYSVIPSSAATITMFNIAEQEAKKNNEDFVSIEHVLAALFRIDNKILNFLWEQCLINRLDKYEEMITLIQTMTIVEPKVTEDSENNTSNENQELPSLIKLDENNSEKKTQQDGLTKEQKAIIDALNKYTTDLTQIASDGKLDPVLGRDDEIRRIIQILNRRSKNNPVVIGNPGVGKTAIVEGLAQRIVSGDVPDSLKNDRILSLDIGAMLAGASYRGEFEERLKLVLKGVEENADDLMLFIDEIHTIMGAGATEGFSGAGDLIKPILARGSMRIIGATTFDEYKMYIEKDKALERRFQPVMADEPSVETTIRILRGLKDKYEAFHKIQISDNALVAAAKLSQRYIQDRNLPDKAIDLIDEAASTARIEIETRPEAIDVLIREKIGLETDIKALKSDSNDESEKKIEILRNKIKSIDEKMENYNTRWEEEKKQLDRYGVIKTSIEKLKKQVELAKQNPGLASSLNQKLNEMISMLDKLKLTQGSMLKTEISADDIADVVSKWTGIPVSKLTQEDSEKLVNMEDYLHHRVVGQEEAIVKISNAIRLSRSGLKDPKRPIGVFLFLGPTGVGKTELAKTLAQFLFNDEDALIRIDMSEFMEKENVSRLIGATAGYIGYEEGGQLTEAVRKKPYSVVLFDEVEKAHPDIFNLMLQMFDDGRLTDGQGRLIDFKNTVIILTSNIASEFLIDENLSDDEKSQAVKNSLKQKFKPEFINRIDEIISFKPITLENLSHIFDIQFSGLKSRLDGLGIELEINPEAKEFVTKSGFDPMYGARPLKRAIRELLEIPLSMELLDGKITRGDKITAILSEDKVEFRK